MCLLEIGKECISSSNYYNLQYYINIQINSFIFKNVFEKCKEFLILFPANNMIPSHKKFKQLPISSKKQYNLKKRLIVFSKKLKFSFLFTYIYNRY